MRLDRWLRQHFSDAGQGRIQKLLRKGQVRVDGGRVKADTRLHPGQSVRIPPELTLAKETKPAKPSAPPRVNRAEAHAFLQPFILHRDRTLLVLNKPAGVPVQGGTGQRQALDRLLLAAYADADVTPRLVHRLDKDTSGLLLVALTATAARHLTRSFRDDKVDKLYWALTDGVPSPTQGRIDLPLSKAEKGDGADLQEAVTDFHLLDRLGDRIAWLALRPRTGRTHQLRRHCLSLHTPVLGDRKYGRRAKDRNVDLDLPKGLALHARAIRFPHPKGGTAFFEAPVSADWRRSFAAMGFSEADAGAPFDPPE